MGGWMAFCWQVKWILRSSALLLCLASDRSVRGVTGQHAPCLSSSTKLTYSRLSAQILLHHRRCRRTPLWHPLNVESPQCISGSLIAGPCRRLAVLLLPLAAHSAKISTTWLRIDVKRIYDDGAMMAGPEGSCSLL